jgi:hypothetical protein
MDEKRFEAELGDLAAGLAARRGDCPGADEIAAHAAGELAGAAGERVAAHVGLCPRCRELAEAARAEPREVDEVTWRRARRHLDARPAPWRPSPRLRRRPLWLGVAAAVVAATAGLSVWVAVGRPPADGVATTRGATVQAVAPVGVVAAVDAFDWQAPPLAVAWRVELRRGDALVWAGTAAGPPLAAPPALSGLLRSGVEYRWRVEGVADDGRVVAGSGWVPFSLRREARGVPARSTG